MVKRRFSLLLCVCLASAIGSVFAEDVSAIRASQMRMISAEDPILEDIRFLTRSAGISALSWTPPLSPAEVERILDSIDESALSESAREAYLRTQKALRPDTWFADDLFAVAAHATVQVGGRVRSNTAIPWSAGDGEQATVFALPLDFFFAHTVQLHLEPFVGLDPSFNKRDGNWGTNLPLAEEQVDMSMPFRAFATAGGSWWNIQLGRDRLSFGSGHTGNLVLSSNPDYYDFARLSFFSQYFKYSAMVSQMPLHITSGIYEGELPLANGVLSETMNRHLYLHRLDFNLFKRLSIGLTEGLMVGSAPLELRYLNPLMIFHSFFSGWDYPDWLGDELNASIFSVDLNWAIWRSLLFYGQFALNEFSTAYERERWPETQDPNGMGLLAGLEYSHSFGLWGALFYGEFVYTDPYLYHDNSPFASFVSMRYLSISPSRERRYQWIGYGEGRDAIVFALGARLFRGDTLNFSGKLSFVTHGEHNIQWNQHNGKPYNQETTPTGVAEHSVTFGLGADWKPIPSLTLSLSGAFIAVRDAGHISGQNEYGVEAGLTVTYTY